jgi:hypothetical protein
MGKKVRSTQPQLGIFMQHFLQQVLHLLIQPLLIGKIKVNLTVSVFLDHFSFITSIKKNLPCQS